MEQGPGALRGRAWIRIGGALALATLLIAAMLVIDHRLGPKHFEAVEPAVLYRSAVLPPDQLEEVVEDYGIRTVVNLRSTLENEKGDWHRQQAELLASRDVALVDLPMHTGYPPDDATLDAWLSVLAEADRQPILVHCEYGVVRTGMMVEVYEMEHRGRSNQQAIDDFERFAGKLEDPVRSRVLEYLGRYAPRSSSP